MRTLLHEEKLVIEFEEISKTTVKNIIKNIASEFNQQVSINDISAAMINKNRSRFKRIILEKIFN